MIYKKRSFILTIFVIIIIQILLYVSNNRKSAFRYFIWNIEEVKIGKLIGFSFVSGLLMSSLLQIASEVKNKNNLNTIDEEKDSNYANLVNENEINTSESIPPQRDIRDPQPTISVNYRVIKKTRNSQKIDDDDYFNEKIEEDDWDNNERLVELFLIRNNG